MPCSQDSTVKEAEAVCSQEETEALPHSPFPVTGMAGRGCQACVCAWSQVYTLAAVPGHLTSPQPIFKSKWTSRATAFSVPYSVSTQKTTLCSGSS